MIALGSSASASETRFAERVRLFRDLMPVTRSRSSGFEVAAGVLFSRRRHLWTHVAYQLANSGGGSSGAREVVGASSATSRCNVGSGASGCVSAETWGD